MTNVYLPERIAAKLQLLLMDPSNRRMRWGAWQALVERLVTKWVEEQTLDPTQANTIRVTPHRGLAAGMAQGTSPGGYPLHALQTKGEKE